MMKKNSPTPTSTPTQPPTNQSMVSVYRPKEVDDPLGVDDDEAEMLEVLRHVEKHASSKSVLNLFKLMDNNRKNLTFFLLDC